MSKSAATDPQSDDLESAHALLRSASNREQLDGIDAAARLREAGKPLVPLLAAFLASTDYVPCTARRYEFSGHALLAFHAMQSIQSIGVAPDVDILRDLLANPAVTTFPEASYDQGAYIGDYSNETLAPAGLAAELVPLLGQESFVLLPDLFAAAQNPADEIGRPARRAIGLLGGFLTEASAGSRSAFAETARLMAALPEALAPTSMRGFDLRDLATAMNKRLLGTAKG